MRSKWIVWAKAQEVVGAASAMAVLMELADHGNAAGECFPSIARIASSTRLGERTVRRQIAVLEGLGLLRREIGGGWIAKGQGRPNRFFLIASAGDQPAAGEACEGKATRPQWSCGDEATRPPWPGSSESAFTENIEQIGKLPGHGGRGSEVSKKEEGGGSAHAHTHEPARGATIIALRRSAEPDAAEEPTGRERLLVAMGHDPSGLTATGGLVGNQVDMIEGRRWQTELGLTLAEQLAVIADVMATKRDGPAKRFTYFRDPMKRLADAKREPPLQVRSLGGFRANREAQRSRRIEQTERILMAAAIGSTSDWRPGMPEDGHVPFGGLISLNDEAASPEARERMRMIMAVARQPSIWGTARPDDDETPTED